MPAVSVAPPITWTGETTLAFGAGVQIVTDGLTVLIVHCAATGKVASRKAAVMNVSRRHVRALAI
jgi:hypothetical protein